MKFTSLEQIKNEFNLNQNERDEIRSELRLKLAELHPDKIGKENFNIEEFTKVKDAIDYIDTFTKDLVPVEQVTDLIKIVKDLTNKNNIDSNSIHFNNNIDDINKERKEALLAPKISLSVITAFLTFLWLFPKTVEEHPILKKYITFENEFSTIIWIGLLFYTILFWMLITRAENRSKNLSKKLKTERTQNALLESFRELNGTLDFVKSDFIEHIFEKYGIRSHRLSIFLLVGNHGIEQETAENLANLIIEKAKNKGVINEINGSKSLDEKFEWK